MVEMNEKRDTHVMARGSYLSPKQKVEADVPEVLNDWKPEWPKNRLGLAKWLVDPENPLTARVIVNRWWGQFFGSGIVSTEEDFGSQERTTHTSGIARLAGSRIYGKWMVHETHSQIDRPQWHLWAKLTRDHRHVGAGCQQPVLSSWSTLSDDCGNDPGQRPANCRSFEW